MNLTQLHDEYSNMEIEEKLENIDYYKFPLSISTEMHMTGICLNRMDTLLKDDANYSEEALSDIFRKIRTHVENSFNNLKHVILKKDISDTSEMENFMNNDKHNLKKLFSKFKNLPLERIDLFRFERQKYSYMTTIDKVNEMYDDANIYNFIESINKYIEGLINSNKDRIIINSKNKKYNNRFKSDKTLNNFLKDIYAQDEKTTDTLRKGSLLFENMGEVEKCLNASLEFKSSYKESIKLHELVNTLDENVNKLFDKLDDNVKEKLSNNEIKKIYKNLDMRSISHALSLYGVIIQLYMAIEHNLILSTKKLITTLHI